MLRIFPPVRTACRIRTKQACLPGWKATGFHALLGLAMGAWAGIEAAAEEGTPDGSASRISIPAKLNNSHLVPIYRPDSQVAMEGISPDWVKTLIMAEWRIETATSEGTFESAVLALDHYQEMGVNGLWINPIYERGSKGNGYLSFGPHTIEPLLNGNGPLAPTSDANSSPSQDSDKKAATTAARKFVEEAHRRNIRIFWDIVVWGTSKDAPLWKEHPEFYRKNGAQFVEVWGGYAFDWDHEKFREWYREQAVKLIAETGADGFRVDLAPDTSGYFFRTIREELHHRGRKIAIFSELQSRRENTFDFEQFGVHGWTEEPDYLTPGAIERQKREFGVHHDFLLNDNIVDVIRTGRGIGKAQLQQQGNGGTYRFYTSNLLHHDDHQPFVRGSSLRIGYTGLFAPFIPMWWIGEEWNNTYRPLPGSDGVMFFNTIDWSTKDEEPNRLFFERVKQMIRIRRSYPEIFEYFPENHRDSNIQSIATSVDGIPNRLQAYARYRAGKAILIIPNMDSNRSHWVTVAPDWEGLRFASDKSYRVVDLMDRSATRTELIKGALPKEFQVEIQPDSIAVLLAEPDE